jgi:uncharacterized protein YcbX
MHLSAIWIYPVKSFYGISLASAQVLYRGLQFDRRWMVVDGKGDFMTQREHPEMVLIGTHLDASGLTLFHRQKPEVRLTLPFQPEVPEKARVTVWSDTVQAEAYDGVFSDWLKQATGLEGRLVKMAETSKRQIDTRYGRSRQYVSFADGYPVLVATEAAIRDLNARLEQPVDMRRFRPNLVIEGAEAHAEDGWSDFSIGAVRFSGVKKCARCPVTTIDPETAEKTGTPLKQLGEYRRMNGKVYFGQNAIPESEGMVSVGDAVMVHG